MVNQKPLLITVAPNGARKSKQDHPALPISPQELAQTAVECSEAGAAMIHLHVRDPDGRHSILPRHYAPALEAVQNAVGDSMIIQVTSESAGVYNRHQQEEAIRTLMPSHVSVGLRELVPDEDAYDDAARLFSDLLSNGTLIQYILYDLTDLKYFKALVRKGVIPGNRHFVLLVLGRYDVNKAQANTLKAMLCEVTPEMEWMCCAFGPRELAVMQEVTRLGGHVRVGFENNTQLPDGRTVANNSELVHEVAEEAKKQQRQLAAADWLRRLQQELTS